MDRHNKERKEKANPVTVPESKENETLVVHGPRKVAVEYPATERLNIV